MSTATRTTIFLGSLLLLAACGSKGPLILPPKPATPAAAPQSATIQTQAQPAVPVDHNIAPEASR